MIAQTATGSVRVATPLMLHIEILEGEGALNNIRQRDAREPIIQVTDENHKPVSGVAVLFLIHGGPDGGSASFAGQSLSLSTTTSADGTAHAAGLVVGRTPGTFTIAVTATLGVVVATTVIHQSAVSAALTGSSSAGAGVGAASAGTAAASRTAATPTVAHHTILGLSKAVAIAVGSAATVGLVVGVLAATRSNGTTVTLAGATVGQ